MIVIVTMGIVRRTGAHCWSWYGTLCLCIMSLTWCSVVLMQHTKTQRKRTVTHTHKSMLQHETKTYITQQLHIIHTSLTLSGFKVQWCQAVTLKSVQCHPGLTYIFNFWHSGTLALRAECQSARMSEITNVGETWMAKCNQLTNLTFIGLKVFNNNYQYETST